MSNYVYEMTVKLPNGRQQKIQIRADSSFNAKAMAESQYGRGSVLGSVRRI